MSTGPIAVHIGAIAEETNKALPEITKTIMQIINSSAGDNVKNKALDIIRGTFEVRNVNLSGCNIEMGMDKS